MKQGYVGIKLAEGETVLTITGRETSPFPKLDFETNRKTLNSLKRVQLWLHSNAVAEAIARNDEFTLMNLGPSDCKKFTQAILDLAEYYLFEFEPRM